MKTCMYDITFCFGSQRLKESYLTRDGQTFRQFKYNSKIQSAKADLVESRSVDITVRLGRGLTPRSVDSKSEHATF